MGQSPRSKKPDEEERQAGEEAAPARAARGGCDLPALRPDDVEGEERHEPRKRHVLLRRGERAGRMVEDHGAKPPDERNETRRKRRHSEVKVFHDHGLLSVVYADILSNCPQQLNPQMAVWQPHGGRCGRLRFRAILNN